MPSPFVPLLPSSAPSGAVNLPSASPGNPVVVKAFAPLASPPSAAASVTDIPAACAATPSVTLQKDGDRVTHIRVQCTCGQVIELECGY